jgi:NADH:ubiquinone oxidoreductase subunit 6 (subunit J)
MALFVFGHQMVKKKFKEKFKHWWRGVIKTRLYSIVCLMSLYFLQV